MANRQQRRAADVVIKKLPPVPNISGTDECCGNCKFSRTAGQVNDSIGMQAAQDIKLGRPPEQPVPIHVVVCFESPMPYQKPVWAWCGRWKATA